MDRAQAGKANNVIGEDKAFHPGTRLGVGPGEGEHICHRSQNSAVGCWTKEACQSRPGKEGIGWEVD